MIIGILRKVRNEYGKMIRKDYENHKISEKRANMTEYEVNDDGIIHSITTVIKDNILVDKVGIKQATKQGFIECRVGGGVRCLISYLRITKRKGAGRWRYFTDYYFTEHGYLQD